MADTINPATVTFRRKHPEVEAKQYNGFGSLNVISIKNGQQTARPGDFLVTDEDAIASLRQQEKSQGLPEGSLGSKGTVYVMTKPEFFAEFEMVDSKGDVLDINDASKPLYGVPNYPNVETAQAAAAASDAQPFRCTIGTNIQLYSIQKDGVITVVPTVPPDPTQDVGPTTEEGVRTETVPQSLQNEAVHETLPSTDGTSTAIPTSEVQAPLVTPHAS